MKYRIALVEYLNTLPFSEGIKRTHLDEFVEVKHATPAQCAQLFEEGLVDISLCPVGALPDLPTHEIRGNYCIGADGAVDTVVLLSKVPLQAITSVRLDDHSRTSNLLLQILADKLWKMDWAYLREGPSASMDSCLMIGDKVFAQREFFPYQYDLASAWKELTGLPMVFAVWITKPGISEEIIQALDRAFETGMELVQSGSIPLEKWESDYLLHNISYPLDAPKRKAMQLFAGWAKEMEAAPVNK